MPKGRKGSKSKESKKEKESTSHSKTEKKNTSSSSSFAEKACAVVVVTGMAAMGGHYVAEKTEIGSAAGIFIAPADNSGKNETNPSKKEDE